MNEIKKEENNQPSDAKNLSHASKYEIPVLDRTLSNGALAARPGQKVPVSPIAPMQLTETNPAETSRFGGVAV